MSRLIVSVTIDTEADSDTRWRTRTPLTFESVVSGVRDLLSPMFREYSLPAVYFLSPNVLNDTASCRVISSELEKGAEAGAHVHVEEFDGFKRDVQGRKPFIFRDFSDNQEFEILCRLDRLISSSLGVKAVSFRAGRFGADINTMLSLARLGYKVDSSVTPGIDWSREAGADFRAFPDQPYFVDLGSLDFSRPARRGHLLEVPVSISGKRLFCLPDKWFFYRWLRPTHMTLFEMKLLVDEFRSRYSGERQVFLCMMFHSMELIPKASPYVRDRFQQRFFLHRLEGIIRYLSSLGAEFKTLSGVYSVLKEEADGARTNA